MANRVNLYLCMSAKWRPFFPQHNQTRHQRYRTERRFALIRGEIACSRECECGPATGRRSAQGVPERSLSRLGEDPTYLRPQRAQAGGQNKVSFEIREAQTLQDV